MPECIKTYQAIQGLFMTLLPGSICSPVPGSAGKMLQPGTVYSTGTGSCVLHPLRAWLFHGFFAFPACLYFFMQNGATWARVISIFSHTFPST